MRNYYLYAMQVGKNGETDDNEKAEGYIEAHAGEAAGARR
jgi:hypothetical protein